MRAQPEPDEVKLGHAFRVGAEGDQAVSLMVTLLERQDGISDPAPPGLGAGTGQGAVRPSSPLELTDP